MGDKCHSHEATHLSGEVKYILVDIGELYKEKRITNNKYLTEQLTFNWQEISLLFEDLTEEYNIHTQGPAWFEKIIHVLWPVFAEAHTLYYHERSQPYEKKYWLWTRQERELQNYSCLFIGSQVLTTEVILFQTAVIERSLGNLFLTKGKNVPSLLRDLLSAPEMLQILGMVPMLLLKILMGTPLALNLRNIVWHGFPHSEEMYPHYASILFVIITSIGEILQEKNMQIKDLPARAQTQYKSELFDNSYLDIKENYLSVLKTVHKCKFIPTKHEIYWKHGIEYYMNQKYGRSIMILLPQLENLLRCLYCTVNNCPERVLTAESSVFYVTLNEIMAETFGVGTDILETNKLINVLGENVMEMLQDLFTHQTGPRIRDKLSHGECNLHDIPASLTKQVLSVALVVLQISNKHKGNELSLSAGNHFENRLHDFCKSYKSHFHISALVRTNITTSLLGLRKWDLHTQLQNTDSDTAEVLNDVEIFHIKKIYMLSETLGIDIRNKDIYHSIKLKTIFRSKIEAEVLNILKQITENISQINSNIVESLDKKHSQYSKHEMRSRQRETYQRMMNVIPYIKHIIWGIMCIVVVLFSKINSVSSMSPGKLKKFERFLRVTLKFVQNAESYTHENKNRWLEIDILAKKYWVYIFETSPISLWMPTNQPAASSVEVSTSN